MRFSYINVFLAMAMLVISFACNNNKNENPNLLIAGTTSKTWKADKETNAAGEKDKLSSEEKKERLQFFANGTFVSTSPTENVNGTWTYDQNAKNLSLQFQGANVTENFSVTKLEDDEMTLKAGDGSEMKLEKE